MRDYKQELKNRVEFIEGVLETPGAKGIVFGASGGKDSALVGILCKKACDNTVGLIMPGGSRRNYNDDLFDAQMLTEKYNIDTRVIDLGPARQMLMDTLTETITMTAAAEANISPRLRMTTLYAVAASENRLVAGTGNRSESYMGYFTKWGDGAYDFNPIADLTVTEIYEFLTYLKAPERIINKAPSAGLFDGQTDEAEMGISYKRIDDYILNGAASETDKIIITGHHAASAHKREKPIKYRGIENENQ